MNAIKYKNALKHYTGHKGEETVGHILRFIPEILQKELSGKQIGILMNAISAAFKEGRALAGAEIVDENAVWIDSIQKMVEF